MPELARRRRAVKDYRWPQRASLALKVLTLSPMAEGPVRVFSAESLGQHEV